MNYRLFGTVAKLLPHQLQRRFLHGLVARPQRMPTLESDFMRKAIPLRYGEGQRNVCWMYGEGPLVVCIHGWGGGGAADMGLLAGAVADKGYRVIALDLSGHGSSSGEKIGFGIFIRDIEEFCSTLSEPVHCYIGFSAGGLCMMAARANGKLSAQKFVCISSPREPYPPIYLLKKKLGVGESMLEQIRSDIAQEFGCPWQEITNRCFSSSSGEELLLVYDVGDSFVQYADAERIAKQWSGARLKKTAGNKHRAMLAADEVIWEVCGFI
jgi:hypothetical protein